MSQLGIRSAIYSRTYSLKNSSPEGSQWASFARKLTYVLKYYSLKQIGVGEAWKTMETFSKLKMQEKKVCSFKDCRTSRFSLTKLYNESGLIYNLMIRNFNNNLVLWCRFGDHASIILAPSDRSQWSTRYQLSPAFIEVVEALNKVLTLLKVHSYLGSTLPFRWA